MSIDPSLLKHCQTNRQREILQAVINTGSSEQASEYLGIHLRNVQKAVQKVKHFAALKEMDLGSYKLKAADGYQLNNVTVQRRPEYECPQCGHEDPERIMQVWDRQSPEGQAAAMLAECIMEHEYKPAPEIPPPVESNPDLLSLYTITDFHVGMYAWAAETGDNWSVDIASRVLMTAISDMCRKAPDSKIGMLNIQGDWCHWDGLDAVTPTNRHILDADTRFCHMIEISMDLIDWAIEKLLKKHEEVAVIVAEGNHDLFGSAWLRKHIKKLWADNPRVSVDDTEFPFYAYLHGRVMLAFHHGHKVKNERLPALFASEPRYRGMWGQASICYIHTGHYHHSDKSPEVAGAIVERHPTLAARDAHAARGGYVAKRAAHVITYDVNEGEVERATVVPR